MINGLGIPLVHSKTNFSLMKNKTLHIIRLVIHLMARNIREKIQHRFSILYSATRKNLAHTILLVFLVSCGETEHYAPKPRGYFRIKFPKKTYQTYIANCPYSFEYPVYAKVVADSSKGAQPYWKDVVFPQFQGKLHLTYQKITNSKMLNNLIQDAHTFAFKHTIKAEAIDEATLSYPQNKVYGVYYIIQGNTASSLQFYLTDNATHYLRGSLYFWNKPRLDSIKPVLDFVRKDVNRLIKTMQWK